MYPDNYGYINISQHITKLVIFKMFIHLTKSFTMDGLSAYLALENAALTKRNQELETQLKEFLDRQQRTESEIANMVLDIDRAEVEFEELSTYTAWLESRIHFFRVPIPAPVVRLNYQTNNLVTVQKHGRTWKSTDLVNWRISSRTDPTSFSSSEGTSEEELTDLEM